jgi:hypothetical protein
MNKSLFREIKEGEDVTDIVAKIFVFIAIPAAVFVIVVALWQVFLKMGNACASGSC